MRLASLVMAVVVGLAVVPAAGAWTWPVDGPVLRPFTVGADPYAGGQHRGVDVGADLGDIVRAPVAGHVSFAGTLPHYGHVVTIRAGGYAVTLLHVGDLAVARDAEVIEGQPVARVGPTGELEHAAPYVHLGVRNADDDKGYVDPLTLLPARSTAAVPEPPPAAAEPQPALAVEPVAPAAEPEPPVAVPVEPSPPAVAEPVTPAPSEQVTATAVTAPGPVRPAARAVVASADPAAQRSGQSRAGRTTAAARRPPARGAAAMPAAVRPQPARVGPTDEPEHALRTPHRRRAEALASVVRTGLGLRVAHADAPAVWTTRGKPPRSGGRRPVGVGLAALAALLVLARPRRRKPAACATRAPCPLGRRAAVARPCPLGIARRASGCSPVVRPRSRPRAGPRRRARVAA